MYSREAATVQLFVRVLVYRWRTYSYCTLVQDRIPIVQDRIPMYSYSLCSTIRTRVFTRFEYDIQYRSADIRIPRRSKQHTITNL